MAAAFNWRTTHILGPVVNNIYSRSPVNALQVRDDRLLIAFSDATVRLFDRASGIRLWTLEGHTGPVNCLHSSKTRMVTGADDKTIRLWDMREGKSLLTLEGHIAPVLCVRLSDRHILSGGRDHTIKVWDKATGTNLRTLRGHTGRIVDLQLSPGSGSQFFTSSTDGTIKLWDIRSENRLRSYKGHKKAIVSFHYDGSDLVSAADDAAIKAWDTGSGKCMSTLHVGSSREIPRSLRIRNNLLFCGESSGTIRIREASTGTPVRLLEGHASAVVALQVEEYEIWSGSADSTVRRWSTEEEVRVLLERMKTEEFELVDSGPGPLSSTTHSNNPDLPAAAVAAATAAATAATTATTTAASNTPASPSAINPNAFNTLVNNSSNNNNNNNTSGGSPNSPHATAAAATGDPSLIHDPSRYPKDGNDPLRGGASPLGGGNLGDGTGKLHPTASSSQQQQQQQQMNTYIPPEALAGTTVEPAWATGDYHVVDVSRGDSPVLTCALGDDVVVYGTENGDVVVIAYTGEAGVSGVGPGAKTTTKNASDAYPQSTSLAFPSPIRAVFVSGKFVGLGTDDGSISLVSYHSPPELSATLVWTVHHHTDSVSAIQSNGSLVVSGSLDATLVISKLGTGELVHKLAEHTSPVTALHFLASTIVSGAADGTLAIWDASTGSALKILTGHKASVTALEFDDLEVLSASEDATIRVWDVATGECVRMYSLGEGEARINCLQFDDSKIVHGLANGDIVVRDMETGDRVRILSGHTESVTDLAYRDNVIISSSRDASLRVWSFLGAQSRSTSLTPQTSHPQVGGGGQQQQAENNGGSKYGVTPATAAAAAGAKSKKNKSKSKSKSKSKKSGGEFGGGGGLASDVQAGASGTLGAGADTLNSSGGAGPGDWEAIMGEWSSNAVKRRVINRGKNSAISCLAFEDDMLVAGGTDGVAKMWDISSGSRVKTFRGHLGGVNTLAYRSDMLVTGDDLQIRLWSVSSNSCISTLDGHTGPVLALGFNADVIASGSRDHTIKIWDTATGRLVRTLKGHNGRITDLVLAGSIIVSSSTDGSLKLWDINSSQRVRSFKGHTLAVNTCDLVNTTVVSGSADGSVRLWDLGTGDRLAEFGPSTPSDVTLCLQADDQKIVSGTRDGSIVVRRMEDGQVVRAWDQHSRAVNAVAFDSTRIISGSEDRTLKVIELFGDDGIGNKNKSCSMM